MADGAGEKVSYWREITLVYPDEEITVVLPAPIITRLQEGDMKLMADIKKNIKETGVPLPADCSEKMSTQSIENVVDDLDHACPQTPMPSPESGSEPSTSSEKELPKVWNKKETQLLFHARMKLEKEFSEARSHKTLWDKIAKELKSAGCLVTARQCENKYKSLKREYRATIDHNSRSGNDRKSCAFFEEFSELYGMKAGSRPKFTIGSFSGSDRSQMQESFSSSDEQLPSSKEKHTRNKKDVQKRKTDGVTEWLQQYEERNLIDLPEEVNLRIASFLDRKSQISFAGVSRYCRFIVFSIVEDFCISCSALGNNVCFLNCMKSLRKLSVIGHYDEKKCHLEALRMLAVYVQDFHALKCIEFSGVQIDFSILHQIIVNAKSLEIICAKASTPFTLQFVSCLLAVKKNMKFIEASIDCNVEEQKEWAIVINKYAGKICFGHDIIDSVRSSLLHYPRSFYSIPNPSGEY